MGTQEWKYSIVYKGFGWMVTAGKVFKAIDDFGP